MSDAAAAPQDPPAPLLVVVQDLFASLPVPALVVDPDGLIVQANPELLDLLGYPAREILGQPVEFLVPEAAREAHGHHRRAFQGAPRARRMGAAVELSARHRDGRAVPVEIALKPLVSNQARYTLCVLVDLTERKQLEARLREQNRWLEQRVAERTVDLERRNLELAELLDSLERARFELERLSREDALIGLTNRRELLERMQSEFRRARRRGSPTAVAMLDLNHFKQVNDALGHAVGDHVLQRVARLLHEHCRTDDVVARYGGEEFVLLLPETSLPDAVAICERIRAALEREDWQGLGLSRPVTVSSGVVECRPGESESAALARADRLLYQAKAGGRNRTCAEE